MRKHVMIPALLALSVGLAACSHDPNANLEAARTNFSSLQSDPQASKVAALETKDAQDWLNKADKAYMDREDEQKVDQLAYLTNQRVEVAKQTIALRTAEGDLKNLHPLTCAGSSWPRWPWAVAWSWLAVQATRPPNSTL